MKPDRIVIGTDNPRTAELLRALYEPFNRNHERVIVMEHPLGGAHEVRRERDARDQDQLHERARERRGASGRGHRGRAHGHRLGSADRLLLHLPRVRLRRLLLPKGRAGARGVGAAKMGYDSELLKAVENVNQRQKQVLFAQISKHFGAQA